MKPTVGLTGGIACGKSTVARMFREDHAIPVVDADLLAREVVAPGSDGLEAVVDAFGSEFLDAEGGLDRAKMGALVFEDPEKRKLLNSIVHPRIAAAGMQAMQALQSDPAPYLIYEAALLVENELQKMFGALVVVSLQPDVQLQRLMARDASTEAEARARIDSQLPLADKVAVADWVIDNGGTEEQTRARVADVHTQLVERFA